MSAHDSVLEPYGIAIPANDSHFIIWVENFIEILEGGGQLQHLENKWFGNMVETIQTFYIG
jgi:hypothetical protein